MSTLLPSIYSLPHTPLPSNDQPTSTFLEQSETEHLIASLVTTTALPYLPSPPTTTDALGKEPASQGTSAAVVETTTLRRNEHSAFLAATLFKLPAPYVALDASRPWLLFWTLHSLELLGIGIDAEIQQRAISTLTHFLSPLGGFSGGPTNTQLPHLLPTYASTLSLAMTGHAGPGGGWHALAENRQRTYEFFMRCKQPDGRFVVCQGGEVDVRGTYCLLVVATLLDLLTPELLRNVDTFLASCQTYEGGFACSAFPFPSHPGAAMAEAHGGYTSCALLAHFLLSSILPSHVSSTSTLPPSVSSTSVLPPTVSSLSTLPSDTASTSGQPGQPATTLASESATPAASLGPHFPRPIDVQGAIRWSTLMQGEAIEAGGFRGRSNKLVDGCYSWWVGGGFPVLEELARREAVKNGKQTGTAELFNRVALQEYVLVAAQNPVGGRGGLRDKPGKHPDLYHTCNNLSGLSIAQYHCTHPESRVAALRASFDPAKGFPAVTPTTAGGGWASEEERQAVRREVWANALAWVMEEAVVVGDKANRVNPTTPVFNIVPGKLTPFINFFYGQAA